jgi:tRNA threonylcarbamoyladenosine biosynthesis protein TsaB
VCKEAGVALSSLDAIAVSKGPGSYTGLRIGVSAAKGLCFALDKPLIAISTLQSMAGQVIELKRRQKINFDADLFCPMIDARRMEVYCALYDRDLLVVQEPIPRLSIPNPSLMN